MAMLATVIPNARAVLLSRGTPFDADEVERRGDSELGERRTGTGEDGQRGSPTALL
jgi:hypothetical protein